MRFESIRSRAIVWALALLALGLAGCAAPGPSQSLRTLTDRQAAPQHRVAALGRLGPVDQWPQPARAVATLSDIAWSDSQPDVLRIAAIDRLLAHDPAALRASLDRYFLHVDREPIRLHVFDLARRRQWRDFTAMAVRSYARPRPGRDDLERPERSLIEQLNPGRAVDDVLLEMVIGLPGPTTPLGDEAIAAAAAWTVLNRLAPPPAVRAMLESSPPATALVADLQAAAAVVDVLPADIEAIRWLMALRAAEDGRWWRRAAKVVPRLTPLQRQGLELRHLPVLLMLPKSRLASDREELVRAVTDRLAGAVHVARTDFGALAGPASQRFADHEAAMCWADLATVLTLLDAMRDRRVVTQWFAQADADLLDTRTEHGGVLAWRDAEAEPAQAEAAFATQPFPPLVRVHDRKFYSSSELIGAMYRGLAHYHFHAQQHDNAAFAGPGPGDLRFADRLRPAAVVLSFLDRDTLNVDYYQPAGVTFDLGVIHR